MLQNNITNTIMATVEALSSFSEQYSCIISTAVLIDTIEKVSPNTGIYPLTVETTVLNPKQYVQVVAKQKITGDIRTIGLRSAKSDKNRWAGHLVAILPTSSGKHHIVDIAIPRASSKKDNIRLIPIVSVVTNNFIKTNERFGIKFNDCYVIYSPYPQDTSYRTSPLWEDRKYRTTIMEQALLNLKK